jgi:xanthine dehydrogenase accessory factor
MDDMAAVYAALAQASAEGVEAALATVVATQGSMPRHAGSKMLVYSDGRIVGTVGGGAMEARVIAAAREVIVSGSARTETFVLNSLDDGDPGVCGGSAQIFIEPVQTAPQLVVVGGGHVGQALAELGKWMGFFVVLSDDRPEFATPQLVPGLNRYVVCAGHELPRHVALGRQSYVCAVTRGMPVDLGLIPALLATDAAYIGLIGSRRRWALTRKALLEQGLSAAQLQRVRSPIGLEIGAETPREIAISILAEIVQVRRGGDGLPMRWDPSLEQGAADA